MSLSHLQADPQELARSMSLFIGHLVGCLRGIVNQWVNRDRGLAERGECLRDSLGYNNQARLIGELRLLECRTEVGRVEMLKKSLGSIVVTVSLWLGWGLVSDTAQASEVGYSADQYWIGKGQGDLAKGRTICLRVSELAARTDLAKQIRVLVKEHLIDRVRERSGRETEQDIELTREEIVQEYLQDVKIVDRQIDEENKICAATAVMSKRQLLPKVPDPTPSPSETHQ
ncbi:MAG TPA: hypothetical protein PLO50_13575 [Nitrospira sp.]|nr:hypothetical protein [Nitrospira sp.]